MWTAMQSQTSMAIFKHFKVSFEYATSSRPSHLEKLLAAPFSDMYALTYVCQRNWPPDLHRYVPISYVLFNSPTHF